MNEKIKLAKLILIQYESLREATQDDSLSNTSNIISLAEELTRDAFQLAQIIEQENKEIVA